MIGRVKVANHISLETKPKKRRTELLKTSCLIILTLCIFSCSSWQKKADTKDDWRWNDDARTWVWQNDELNNSPEVQTANWILGENALYIELNTSDALNTFRGRAHTLELALLQLSSKNAIDKLLRSSSGIRFILKSSEVDTSVLVRESFTLEPGSTYRHSFDRQEGARFIAIVAGYVSTERKKTSRVIPIPGIDDNAPRPGFWKRLLHKFPFIGSSTKERVPIRPAKLNIKFNLGASQIEDVIVQPM